ncbi:hypothetical protein [Lysobacter sp. CA199]|uniref:hypothetical protein n=1 Tax=Lysobacter sp. CA199 TaxID=3455608 RepID=UPI003F8D30BD
MRDRIDARPTIDTMQSAKPDSANARRCFRKVAATSDRDASTECAIGQKYREYITFQGRCAIPTVT